MNWYTVNEEFLNYLREFESRIPIMDYGDDSLKPFFGVLFEIDDLVYVTQVSHPKPRHRKMKDNMDFCKLYKGSYLLGVVNLNYMFPIHKKNLIQINYRNISSFRTFKNDQDKNDYIVLLKREMKEIKRKKIDEKAFDLYKHKYAFPNDKISKRCFEFKDLERKCFEYSK